MLNKDFFTGVFCYRDVKNFKLNDLAVILSHQIKVCCGTGDAEKEHAVDIQQTLGGDRIASQTQAKYF